jgi:regulator of protease activity HflC (stomatin/prohibitin superfamily)
VNRKAFRTSGFPVVALIFVIVVLGGVLPPVLGGTVDEKVIGTVVVMPLSVIIAAVIGSGLTVVNPNQARVVQFFGRYVGTITEPGFHCTLPLSMKHKMSQRVHNFETERLKVSDADGNPVEIACVVVWRVVDTYKASFGVADHGDYVAVQSEAAVRHLATSYPYDAHESGRASLREGNVVSEELTNELRERVELAGVEVLESRITHLAYAPEIAHAMLARQQANAVVSARFKIVEGAVGMVSNALERLREENVVELDEERKAQMVSNLLVVLCGDRAAQPVVNAGSLYG